MVSHKVNLYIKPTLNGTRSLLSSAAAPSHALSSAVVRDVDRCGAAAHHHPRTTPHLSACRSIYALYELIVMEKSHKFSAHIGAIELTVHTLAFDLIDWAHSCVATCFGLFYEEGAMIEMYED